MCAQFDSHVRILLQEVDQLIQRLGAALSQCRLVEIIEDVVDQDWGSDGSQWELEGVFLALLGGIHTQFFLVVEESLAGSHQQIIYLWLDDHAERTITLDRQFLVGAIVANYRHLCRRQFVTSHLIDPSLDGVHNLWILERVDMVVASSVLAVGREVTSVVWSLESHAEVIRLGVERIARMEKLVFLGLGIHFGDVDV